MSDTNAHIAAVLLQLGASDDEIDAAWQVMRTWPTADDPRSVIADCRRALEQVRGNT